MYLNSKAVYRCALLVAVPLLVFSSLFFGPLQAAMAAPPSEDIHILDEMVATSTSKSKLLDTPASISIITADDLEKIGAKNIIEALERISGVFNTSASRTSLSIRGTRSSMAGGPVILVDGVAQNYSNFRREELDIIPVSQIDRIEVLRSAGIAYGPGAARGVISIITKKGKTEKPLMFDFSGSYGSWETHNLSGGLSGRIDQWDYYGNVSHYQNDGYEEEPEERTGVIVKFGYNLSDHSRIGVRGNWVNSDRDGAYGLYKYKWQLDKYRRNIHFPRDEGGEDLVWHITKEQDTALYAIDFCHKAEKLFINGDFSYSRYDEFYKDTKDIFYSGSSRRGDEDDKDQDSYTANLSGAGSV